MKILGLYEGHNGTAALMVNGEVVAAASEERFTRRKNEVGYPKLAIEYCLEEAGVEAEDLDAVCVVSIDQNLLWTKIQREASFSVDDYVLEQHEYFKPVLLEKEDPATVMWRYIHDVEKRKGPQRCNYDFSGLNRENLLDLKYYKALREKTVMDHLGIDKKRLHYLDHHTCHEYYAYYCSPFRRDTLILTADAEGDKGMNATVATALNNVISTVATSTNCQVARIYRYITLLLGMKPFDHEYKVMGLAPYATSKEMERSYRVFENILRVEGLEFLWGDRPRDLYFAFLEALEGHRFDGIAGALQRMTEEVMCKWARNAIRHTGLHDVVFAGGVAMNIKLNLALAELPEVDSIYVGPNPADESNAIGACYFMMATHCEETGADKACIQPLSIACLGPSCSADDVERALLKYRDDERYEILSGVSNGSVAQWLKEGRVVGICRGRMEFGARALGNRSILANPSRADIVQKINSQIKYRDFWMPFTPSVLVERVGDYFENPKQLLHPFMTVGMQSTSLGREHLIAALHPADLTGRPQMVKREVNPDYYELIKDFERLTGIGGVLNTSLNLHGHPLVNTPDDAMFTMDNSELDAMYFGDLAVVRR